MTKINIDTEKLKTCGEDIVTAASDFNTNVTSLFDRIYNVPNGTKEWIGTGAINYALSVIKEKKEYDTYGAELAKLGQCLIDFSDKLDEVVEKTKKYEEK